MTERQPTASFPHQLPVDSPGADSTPLNSGETPTSGLPTSPAADEFLPRPFGRYELRRLLGRGGMGRVYLAHDPQLDRLVALKMPNPVAVAGWRERFFAEARAAATLNHANVCPVHEVGEHDGQPYLTMAFVEGETLAERQARDGRMEPGEAVELVCTVARAMHEAHRRGIVHRDLKPANLMIDANGRVVIMDFGLAIRAAAGDDLRLTLTGVALGTPAYMPPEQAGGDAEAIGPPADVYALGVILYELVTDRVPFKAKSFGKLLAQIERDAPPPPSSLNPAVDPALEAVILKCLAKRPADRFDNAGELANALDRYREGDRNGLVSLYSRPYVIPDTTADFRPATTAEYRQPSRRGWGLAVAAGLAALILTAVVGSIIYVQTDYGELEVKLSDPTAKVKVRVNGQEVTLEDGGRVTRVKAGKGQKLEVSGPDYDTVAESFDLKRGGNTIVQVRLNPKQAVAQNKPDPKSVEPNGGKKSGGPDPPVPGVAVAPMPHDAKPKPPPPFPEKPTLIEVPGWQIYVDATKADMQKWLDDRRKAGHSVVWLDGYAVERKPVYAAVAALDDRESGWTALLDLAAVELADMKKLSATIHPEKNRLVSLSGFNNGPSIRSVALFHPGVSVWSAGPAIQPTFLPGIVEGIEKDGMRVRLLRAYPVRASFAYVVVAAEAEKDTEPVHKAEMKADEFDAYIEKQRAAGYRPANVSVAQRDDQLWYTAVMVPDPKKTEWEVHRNLTADGLKAKAADVAKRGFAPTCLTGYGWEGKTQYIGVWVKEPPRAVVPPKEKTLIEVEGWQILTDATKEEMQKWLDERKKAGHSVMWLDAYEVAGKPVFVAVAALDDRQTDWIAMLEMRGGAQALIKAFDTNKYRMVSMSGYATGEDVTYVFLWHEALKRWNFTPGSTEAIFERDVKQLLDAGQVIRAFRAYPVGQTRMFGAYGEVAAGVKSVHAYEKAPNELTAFLEAQRKNGFRPLSVSASVKEGQPLFAAVMAPNADKREWEVDTSLTTARLKGKVEEQAKKGFRPSCVTAYGYDGAVRYCVVWSKEPPKEKKEPGKK